MTDAPSHVPWLFSPGKQSKHRHCGVGVPGIDPNKSPQGDGVYNNDTDNDNAK